MIKTFDFLSNLEYPAKAKFREIFQCIGGDFVRGQKHTWSFPEEISDDVLSIIIKNTCFVCGGLMKDSTAFKNIRISFDNCENDIEQYGTTLNEIGPVKQVRIRLCMFCGHSHT